MSWAPMVFQAASLVFGAVSAFNQASSQKKWAKYNAAVSRNNAQIAEMQANDAIERGKLARQEHERKVRALSGKQTAGLAAAGLSLGDGTAFNLLSDTELFGRMDANNITRDAERKSWAYKVQGNNQIAEADAFDAKADSISPWGAAGGTLLAGAGSVASSWMNFAGTPGTGIDWGQELSTGTGGPGVQFGAGSQGIKLTDNFASSYWRG